MNGSSVGTAFHDIFVAAFAPEAVLGGALGVTVQKAMRFGVARGLFSNEAGMGSTPHAHATADVKHPGDQGIIAMMGVFIDTFVILTLTALVILSTGALSSGETGSALAQVAFDSAFGSFGKIFIAICMLFFAFTTILGWNYYGERCMEYLFNRNKKVVMTYRWLYILAVFIGPYMTVAAVWNIADIFNALMALPNLIALLVLSNVVVKETKDYFARMK